MQPLGRCDACNGFLVGDGSCPNCGAAPARPSAPTRLATAVLAPVAALTLMACYGAPPCNERVDNDKDGYFVCVDPAYGEVSDRDCDDKDPAIHPGAADSLGDGVDQDCDGKDGPARLASSASGAGASSAPASSSAVSSTSVGPAPTLDTSATPLPQTSVSASASSRPR